MDPLIGADIVAGDRVRVTIPRNEPCSLHSVESVPMLGAAGTVDRVAERLGEHSAVGGVPAVAAVLAPWRVR